MDVILNYRLIHIRGLTESFLELSIYSLEANRKVLSGANQRSVLQLCRSCII